MALAIASRKSTRRCALLVAYNASGPRYFLSGGSVNRVAKSGGSSTKLVDNLGFVSKIVVGGDRVYYFNSGDDDEIRSVPVAGGTEAVVVQNDLLSGEFAVDDCSLYWVDGEGSVRRMPR